MRIQRIVDSGARGDSEIDGEGRTLNERKGSR
jgi:hypothetical protein